MNLFIQKEVFNPQLHGKAVRIKGVDVEGEEWDRVFLVKSVEGELINLINNVGVEVNLHMENFTYGDDYGLKLTVLEVI